MDFKKNIIFYRVMQRRAQTGPVTGQLFSTPENGKIGAAANAPVRAFRPTGGGHVAARPGAFP
ncbi:hypothetical protein [Solidesulfovibrio sp.]|uniref:hypothetical protein n=1 Tax=Solidesulfovibrio sp. TaxID=2910990 RepID=UPI002B1F9A84|nr:hypothetical protein [Solidesulfovibrio sp.]MEA4858126.1 hypothetical protein [Solidesulfovibrio sp.]